MEYTGVDGEKRRMPRDEMQKLLEQQQEDLQSMGKDGKMTKTQQGKARLDEVRAVYRGRLRSSETDEK